MSGSPTPNPPTSGITQPPVLGVALRALMKNAGLDSAEAVKSLESTDMQSNATEDGDDENSIDKDVQLSVLKFVRDRAFDANRRYHNWLESQRNAAPMASDCAWLSHPWASGLGKTLFFYCLDF